MNKNERDVLYGKIQKQLKYYYVVAISSFLIVITFLIANFFTTFSLAITGSMTLFLSIVLVYLFYAKSSLLKKINILINNDNYKYGKNRIIFKKSVPLILNKSMTASEFMNQMKRK
jgi:hypothetical protein